MPPDAKEVQTPAVHLTCWSCDTKCRVCPKKLGKDQRPKSSGQWLRHFLKIMGNLLLVSAVWHGFLVLQLQAATLNGRCCRLGVDEQSPSSLCIPLRKREKERQIILYYTLLVFMVFVTPSPNMYWRYGYESESVRLRQKRRQWRCSKTCLRHNKIHNGIWDI